MNRDEILARSRQENQPEDEREQFVDAKASLFSLSTMIILVVVLCCIRRFVHGGTEVHDLFALLWAPLPYDTSTVSGKTVGRGT